MEKVKIKERVVNRSIVNYIRPKYVYIPCLKENYKINDYIYKGDTIDNNISPVSGYVKGYIVKQFSSGRKINTIIIENDYKDKKRRESIKENNIDKEKYLGLLKKYNLIDYYDTYKIDYLVINAIDTEPYIFSRRSLIYSHLNTIFDKIDKIIRVLKINKAFITVCDDYIYNYLKEHKRAYPNIIIIKMQKFYPIGNNKILLRELFGIEYKITSLEKNIFITKINNLIDMEELLIHNTLNDTVVVTINNKDIINVKVKVGTLLSEILSFLEFSKDVMISPSNLNSQIFSSTDIVISKNDMSFTIIHDRLISSSECTLCGRCIDVCPVGITPVFIMNNHLNKNNLKKMNIDKCLKCGLCSYICPSKINLNNYIEKAMEVLDNE